MKTLFLTLLLVILSASLITVEVEVATLNWEPYIGENLNNGGFIAEIIRESFKAFDMYTTFLYYPWARTIALAKKGKVNAYGPEYYSQKLEENYYISDSFPGGPAGLFCLKKDDIDYEDLSDLKPYRIGVVRGYVNEEKFDEAEYLVKEEVADDLTNVRKLYGNRIDLFFADKYVARWLAQKEGYDPDKMKFIKPMVKHKLYLCFPKNKNNSQNVLKTFNKGLKIIKQNGTLDRIINNKGF